MCATMSRYHESIASGAGATARPAVPQGRRETRRPFTHSVCAMGSMSTLWHTAADWTQMTVLETRTKQIAPLRPMDSLRRPAQLVTTHACSRRLKSQ